MRRAATALVAGALALGIAPEPDVSPRAWAEDNLVVADGPRAGELWSAELTPELGEILDCLAPSHPCTRVSVRKSAQVGFTGAAIAWLGSIVANTPAQTLVVQPTEGAARDFNSEKLHPTLEKSPALRAKVTEAKSRSARASTTFKKRFPGGSITLAIASSTAELRSKTIRFVFADEIDEYPADLNGQGDPMAMIDARQRAFHAEGNYKKLEGSTPTIKGASRIDAAFEEGDQRFFEVPCPHCGAYQRLVWERLRFARSYPFDAHYLCAHCNERIEEHHKPAMKRAGKWVAQRPEPGRHPSFHLDALGSQLTTWDQIAADWWKAQGDPSKLKGFLNLTLGESWEERGEAPEWERLYERREDYARRQIPVGALVYTTFVDVQSYGFWYETVAWGEGLESWSLDAGLLQGDPADIEDQVWRELEALYERQYPDAYGQAWPVDAFGIDSGYLSNQVYLWTRNRPKAFATKGQAGWNAPALGTPSRVDVTWRGQRSRRGAKLWPIGTFSLKAELYAYLRKEGRRDGEEDLPRGWCHFSTEVNDAGFFKQLTAEYLKERTVKGRPVKEWHASGENHFHDCRVGNMALAKGYLHLDRMTADDWLTLARERGVPDDATPRDLVTLATHPMRRPQGQAAPETDGTAHGETPAGEDRGGWLPRDGGGWL